MKRVCSTTIERVDGQECFPAGWNAKWMDKE